MIAGLVSISVKFEHLKKSHSCCPKLFYPAVALPRIICPAATPESPPVAAPYQYPCL